MQSSPSLQIVMRPAGDTNILGDISTGTFRPLVPPVFRQTVIRSLHEVHHPGVRATTRLVKAPFCWPKMGKDIAAAARACMGCQLGKVHRHVKLQPEHIPVPHRRFSHLHIDLAWREGTDFSPAEAVNGAQPLLPGQFLAVEEDPSPSFLSDLQGVLAGRTLLPTTHHSSPAPQELPAELLLAKHVLVRRDGHVPPLAAAYDGPFLVLERSLRFFKLQIGDRVDTVSTLRLKACTSPSDVPVAQPPRRGRPPAAAAERAAPVSTPPQRAQRRRRVTFRCPVVTPPPSPPSPPAQRLHPSGRPARTAGPPRRYLVSRVLLRSPRLGGELWRDDI
jgi:hypothetical protein